MRFPMFAMLVLVCCCCACGAESLTYIDLVKILTDLEVLSVLPRDGERCTQWSSYDRSSAYDKNTGGYLN